MSRLRKLATLLAMAVLVAGAFFFGLAPSVIDGLYNRTVEVELPRVSERTIALHEQAFVVDLHADPLLWDRDLTVRNSRGHVDFPRLREGNVALQVFAAVTKSPQGQNYRENADDSDNITALSLVNLWPIETWTSLEARAHYQARKLRGFLRKTGDPLIRSASQLTVLADRSDPAPVGALLAIEGLHVAEGDIGAIDRLFGSGFRIFGLSHFFDNAMAGSAHGVSKHGLTELGAQAMRRIEELEGIIDLAHASEATIDDVLQRATRPVVVSHSGVRGTCDSPRNLSDRQLRALAERGAVIGIGFWHGALCAATTEALVAAIQHAVAIAGIENIALGSDFDGATAVAFDSSDLEVVTQALLDAGLPEEDVRAILGENARRFLRRWLPGGDQGPKKRWPY